MLTDTELLRRYAHDKVEAAFGELVSRHAPLVYSTALRIVRGDKPLAYDVAQSVFFDFARKAASLCQRAEAETEGGAAVNSSLSGWLYTSTRFAAAKLVRAEQTRRKHEQKAHAMNDLLNAGSAEPDWADLRPVLDDAMGKLEDVDREALLIRFFEGKDLRTVGTILGLSEDAARMRISRSLEKLRQVLAKRGVTTTATALSITLTAHGVTEVPAGMVAALTTTSLAAGSATASSTSTLTTIKLMASLKTKLLIGSLVAVGVAVPLVIQQKSANQLRAENEALRGQVTALQSQPPPVQTNVTVLPEPSSEGPEHSELLRLRGLVARLNAEARNNNQRRTVPQTAKATGADTVDRIGPYELFTGDLLSPRHVDNVKMMKLIGLALMRLEKDESLSPDIRALPFSQDNELRRALKKNIDLPEEDWNMLEILVPNLAIYSQVKSYPGSIVARTKEALPMPDGRWVRVYTRADGSAVNLIHDTPERAIDFGELENTVRTNPPK